MNGGLIVKIKTSSLFILLLRSAGCRFCSRLAVARAEAEQLRRRQEVMSSRSGSALR